MTTSSSAAQLKRLAQLLLALPQTAPWNPLLEYALAFSRPGCALPPSAVLEALLALPGFSSRFLYARLDAAMDLVPGNLLRVVGRETHEVRLRAGQVWVGSLRERCMAMLLLHAPWLLAPLTTALVRLPERRTDLRWQWVGAAVRVYTTLVVNGCLPPLSLAAPEALALPQEAATSSSSEDPTARARGRMHLSMSLLFAALPDDVSSALVSAAQRAYGLIRTHAAASADDYYGPYEPRPHDIDEEGSPLRLPASPSLFQLYASLSTGVLSGSGKRMLLRDPPVWTRYEPMALVNVPAGNPLRLPEVALTVARLLRTAAALAQHVGEPVGLPPAARVAARAPEWVDMATGRRWVVRPESGSGSGSQDAVQLTRSVLEMAAPLAADVGASLAVLEEQLHCTLGASDATLSHTGDDVRAWPLLTALRTSSDTEEGTGAAWPAITVQNMAHWAVLADALHALAWLGRGLGKAYDRGLDTAGDGALARKFFAGRWGAPPAPAAHQAAARPHLRQPERLGAHVHHQAETSEWDHIVMPRKPWSCLAHWRLCAPDAILFLRRTCPMISTAFGHLFLALLQREGASPLAVTCPHSWRAAVEHRVLRLAPRYRETLLIRRNASILFQSVAQLKQLQPHHTVAVEFVGEEGRGDGVTRGWFHAFGNVLMHGEPAPQVKSLRKWAQGTLTHGTRALFYEPSTRGFVAPVYCGRGCEDR